jgi:hypothetical protein
VQGFAVASQGQKIIGSFGCNGLRDGVLAFHGIDCYQSAG